MIRFLILFLFFASLHAEPVAIYLTLQQTPDNCMTICWVVPKTEKEQHLKYREGNHWYQVEASPRTFPRKLPYSLFVVELAGLEADKKYEFVLSEGEETYAFKTLPSTLSHPVKFVVGGDIYHDEIATVEQMNRIAAQQDPDFALLGGDIAYSGSALIFFSEEGKRWIQFLKSWSKTMRQSDGTLIPMITAIGNHDINGRYDQTPEYAPFYYFLFPTKSEMGYRVIDFGHYLSLWVLDSGHTRPVQGDQTVWLEKTLHERVQVPFKLALYHVPAYPSARAFDNKRSTSVRNFWTPLFDKYGLTAAFENHDHAYKRTHLIKEGKVSPEGVLYVGDGAWGVEKPRSPKKPKDLWYLAASAQKRHVVLATVEKDEFKVEAIGADGKVFDSFSY